MVKFIVVTSCRCQILLCEVEVPQFLDLSIHFPKRCFASPNLSNLSKHCYFPRVTVFSFPGSHTQKFNSTPLRPPRFFSSVVGNPPGSLPPLHSPVDPHLRVGSPLTWLITKLPAVSLPKTLDLSTRQPPNLGISVVQIWRNSWVGSISFRSNGRCIDLDRFWIWY